MIHTIAFRAKFVTFSCTLPYILILQNQLESLNNTYSISIIECFKALNTDILNQVGIGRIWVPLIGGVRSVILDESHKSNYSIHPGADKMYYDIRDMYWWPGMK